MLIIASFLQLSFIYDPKRPQAKFISYFSLFPVLIQKKRRKHYIYTQPGLNLFPLCITKIILLVGLNLIVKFLELKNHITGNPGAVKSPGFEHVSRQQVVEGYGPGVLVAERVRRHQHDGQEDESAKRSDHEDRYEDSLPVPLLRVGCCQLLYTEN
jgi:hypothetical protein